MSELGAPALLGLATALPPHRVAQDRAHRFLADRLADDDAARLAERVFPRASVHTRWSCLPDFTGDGDAQLFGDGTEPTTAARMEAYRRHLVPLAARACRAALADAQVAPERIDRLVVVSCTGFYAPGPDIDLVETLDLRQDVARTLVGFMGCYAAHNGLRVAVDHVRADPSARVLLVCAELCSLHATADPDPGSVVAQALFGDGAAACVIGAAEAGDAPWLVWGDEHVTTRPAEREAMGWSIGDHGFRMHLSPRVPQLLSEALPEFVAGMDDVAHWCVHPGGRSILTRTEEVLGTAPGALSASWDVLRDVGNVSSATILFVLERVLRDQAPGSTGALLGFGPGLTLEARRYVRGTR